MNSTEDESGRGGGGGGGGGVGGEGGGLSRLKNGQQEWGQHNNSDR